MNRLELEMPRLGPGTHDVPELARYGLVNWRWKHALVVVKERLSRSSLH